ncbi:MAG: hemolysin family protein [Carbonactinosporaceae bacterium]
MSSTVASIFLVLFFILIGAFFAGAEIALVSLRESRVRTIRRRGRRRDQHVVRLHDDPNRFLSAVQIGVTFAGFFAASFGAATLAEDLVPALVSWGLGAGVASTVALIAITLVISYFSLVLGELVPKRLALQRSELVALISAPTLDRVATLSRPLIWLLSVTTNIAVRVLGGDPRAGREEITEEELRDMVAGHRTLGSDERRLIEEVFSAGERQIREVMVPRTEVDFLDVSTPVHRAAKAASGSAHSRYPVVEGSYDDVVGFVHVRDLFDPAMSEDQVRVGDLSREVKLLPGTKPVLSALSEMRREGQHLAIVVDEYGGTAGIVTLEDLVEELVGDIRDEYDVARATSSRLRSGDMEVDGLLNLEDFHDETGIELPEGPYETVAGFLVARLGHLPSVGESVEVSGYRLTVTELDGRRISRVRLGTPSGPAAVAEQPPAEPEADTG